MLKSISNIAWPQNDERWVLEKLQQRNWNAIEVAPSKVWEDFRKIPSKERKYYKQNIEEYHLNICSLHSLFWGIQGARLFGAQQEQQAFKDYLKELVDLAADLGSRVLILGSPAVRDKGNYEYSEAIYIAAAVLNEPAEYAWMCNVKILIEPLTKKETNFINTHTEGLELIRAIGSNGFGLHLDAKSVAAEEMDAEAVIKGCKDDIEHFHINDPDLRPIGMTADYHEKMGKALAQIGYPHYISVEMKMTENYRQSIEASMNYVDSYYEIENCNRD